MIKSAAGRYAEALIDIASDHDNIDIQGEELARVNRILTADPVILRTFQHPKLDLEARKALLLKLMEPYHFSSITNNFLRLLLAKKRLNLISDIRLKYDEMADKRQARARALLTVAVPLPKEMKNRLANKLARSMKVEIRMEMKVDPEIIGGCIIRVGDTIIDGSVKKRLEMLKRELTG
ncbi:MAG: ATP synthase F1 subunit delta [bacterium]